MTMKLRVAGIYIKNGKILLVRAKNHIELWTPGGTPEENESEEDCLKRELAEEISAKVVKMERFKEFIEDSPYLNKKVKNIVYLVQLTGTLTPDNEIEEIVWVSRKDYDTKRFKYVYIIEEQIIPELISKKLF